MEKHGISGHDSVPEVILFLNFSRTHHDLESKAVQNNQFLSIDVFAFSPYL